MLHMTNIIKHKELNPMFELLIKTSKRRFIFKRISTFPIVEWCNKEEHEQRWSKEGLSV